MAKKDSTIEIPEGSSLLKFRFSQWLGRCSALWASPRRIGAGLGIITIAVVLYAVLGNFGLVPTGGFPRLPPSGWQAVFLTNGQVYFGHLENYNRRYLRLKDVYYLQAAQPLQQGRESAQSLNLVKLGSELHGPEDAMFVPKDKILFWENLKGDSQVVKGIESTRR